MSKYETPLLNRQDCGEMDMRTCYHSFFENAAVNDVLIFQMGLAYSYYGVNGHKRIDMRSWMLHDAAAFKGHIEAVFPGTVFWLSMSPKKQTNATNSSPKAILGRNLMYENNLLLSKIFFPSSGVKQNWYQIDLWSICFDRPQYYDDELHFGHPPLATTINNQILNRLCPAAVPGKT